MEEKLIHPDMAHDLKHKLWLNAWWFSCIIFALACLYELIYEKDIVLGSLADVVALTGAILISSSFALSGFSYYFNFLDNKLGYRKYLGVVGFFYALAYSIMLVFVYPQKYGIGLVQRINEPEVILGLAAMAIFVGMIVISNVKFINQALGVKRWRQGLRLGYIGMILLAIRAYLNQGDVWLAWANKIDSLPPPSLVMTTIVLLVIILRASMIISMYFHKPTAKSANQGKAVIFSVLIILAAVASYLGYSYLTVRLVVVPEPIVKTDTSEQEVPDKTTLAEVSDDALSFLHLPAGFYIKIFSSDLSSSVLSRPGPGLGPRLMMVKDDMVFVAVPGSGSIFVLRDTDGDTKADWQGAFISGLNRPHNIVWHEGWYYISEQNRIIRVKDNDNNLVAEPDSVQVLMSLPTGGHWTRTVKIISNKMYVAVGSSCNVCLEQNERRAAISKCDLDGANCKVFADGLRNTVDFVEHEGQIYGTDNGRDQLGNALPPEEVNLISEGDNYGWPVCYGQNIHDTNFDKNVYIRDPCADSVGPLVELPAHNAPLGLSFYEGDGFPLDYQGDLFVAAHGSWNRQPPDGYKIFRVDWETKQVSDFITGWLGGAAVHGRPVGVVNYKNGLLISDDAAGLIYYVGYSS